MPRPDRSLESQPFLAREQFWLAFDRSTVKKIFHLSLFFPKTLLRRHDLILTQTQWFKAITGKWGCTNAALHILDKERYAVVLKYAVLARTNIRSLLYYGKYCLSRLKWLYCRCTIVQGLGMIILNRKGPTPGLVKNAISALGFEPTTFQLAPSGQGITFLTGICYSSINYFAAIGCKYSDRGTKQRSLKQPL